MTSLSRALSADRIRRDLSLFSRVGYRKDGAFDRLAFSVRDYRAREVLMSLMREIGMVVSTDGFGNVVGTLPGEGPEAGAIVLGSHLDTVPDGGRFDGTAGIVGGLEVIRRILASADDRARTIRLVMFVCEESSRFGMATLGSRVVAGTVDPDRLLALRSSDGEPLVDLLAPFEVDAARIAAARWGSQSVAAYLELHIEQGRVLEEAGIPIGVVTHIAAPTRMRVVVEGRQDHSGATPMTLRADGLCAAAEVILAVEEEARRTTDVVGTVGSCKAYPGVFNVVPGRVEMTVDVRSGNGGAKARVVREIGARIDEIASRRGVPISRSTISDDQPVGLDAALTVRLENACRNLGVAHLAMASGAGHDAMEIATIAPTAMVFVPSHDGVSHSPAEWTTAEEIATGVDVVFEVVQELVA